MIIKSIFRDKRSGRVLGATFVVFAFLFFSSQSRIVFQDADPSLASDGIPGSFADLAKRVNPGVVNVSVIKTSQIGGRLNSPLNPDDPFYEFFRRFYGDQTPRNFTQRGLGTGFIIDREGYILTNNHVAEGADEITVRLSDSREFTAKVIGLDSMTDIALIKIDGAKDLTPLSLGDSDKTEVGDWVVAIGNPFGLEHTVTAGIVSAKYRQTGATSYENYIQTDAAINQGNSGGPLMNINGEVIGINSSIYSQSGGSVGIGFAIPINMAKELLPQLKKGKVVRGWLGVSIQSITPELQEKLHLKDGNGALVSDVIAGGPAAGAGIASGDVIVSFDGKTIKGSNELPFIVSTTPVGKNVRVDVLRNGDLKTMNIKVGELKVESERQSDEDTGGSPGGAELGLTVGQITPDMAEQYNLAEKSGVIIIRVGAGTDAEAAGLQAGDIIKEIDREKVTDISQYNRKIAGFRAGETILFLIKRGGSSVFVTLKISKRQ